MTQIKKYGGLALLYFYLMNVFYLDIGQVVGSNYFLPALLPVVFILTLAQVSWGENIFFAEFNHGACVVYDVHFGLHVDLSEVVVYVADMVRFSCWYGDIYIFDKC